MSNDIKRAQCTINAIEYLAQTGLTRLRKPTPEEVVKCREDIEKWPDGQIHDWHIDFLASEIHVTPLKYSELMLQHSEVRDIYFYCKLPRWGVEEAVALSLGKDPNRIYNLHIKYYSINSPIPFIQNHNKRLMLLKEAIKHGELEELFSPMEFVIWARKKDIELPDELIKLATKYASDTTPDWEARYKELELENRILKQEKMERDVAKNECLDKRIESSYQKLIAGLARLKFPSDDSINAHNIWKSFSKIDLPFEMDEGTIRSRLEHAIEWLEIEPKKIIKNHQKIKSKNFL